MLKALVVTAPDEVREQLRAPSAVRLVQTAAELELGPVTSPVAAATLGLRTLARRYQALSAGLAILDTELDRLTRAAAPKLMALFGVGSDSAGALLVAAGDNPDRLRSNAAFSMLCGASPIQASSGKTHRHRLNGGGDRQANAALYRIVSPGCATTSRPRSTWSAGSVRERQRRKPSAVSSATWPKRSSQSFNDEPG